ncbi:hypothetical protein H2274_07110 [Campylobacter sp. W0049]|uniref:hypothetical protein n=1 Tax=Campylobacter molothri TaxID=1032242 RepID=UPI00301E2A06|nr:hypothetical protein [Campylobacter sp. W0049]
MKKNLKNFLTLILAVITTPLYLFGADGGNIASKLATSVNQQVTEVGSSVASIVNTISIVMGVIWIVIMLLMAFFNMEGIKNHAKLLFGALVIIGVVYGLSKAGMS